jgi:hypothetical protein
MDSITMSKDELKNLVHDAVFETVAEIFTDEDKFLTLLDKIEDRNLGMLIEEGNQTELVNQKEFRRSLKNKIKTLP